MVKRMKREEGGGRGAAHAANMSCAAVKLTCVEAVVVKELHQFCSHGAGGQAELVRCVVWCGGGEWGWRGRLPGIRKWVGWWLLGGCSWEYQMP